MHLYLTSPKIEAPIILDYTLNTQGEFVFTGLMSLPTLSQAQHKYLLELIAQRYLYMEGMSFGLFKVSLDAENANELLKYQKQEEKREQSEVQRKAISLFCGLYYEEFGQQYTLTNTDYRLLNDFVEIASNETITAFLQNNEDWWAKYKSLANYTKNINSIRYKLQGLDKKQKFPNHHDPSFEKKLDSEELPKYWQHLRDLGWQSVKRDGRKVWEKKSN